LVVGAVPGADGEVVAMAGDTLADGAEVVVEMWVPLVPLVCVPFGCACNDCVSYAHLASYHTASSIYYLPSLTPTYRPRKFCVCL